MRQAITEESSIYGVVFHIPCVTEYPGWGAFLFRCHEMSETLWIDLIASYCSCRGTYARDESRHSDEQWRRWSGQRSSRLLWTGRVFGGKITQLDRERLRGASRGRYQLNDRWGAMGSNTVREGIIVNCISLCLSVSARFPNKITKSRKFIFIFYGMIFWPYRQSLASDLREV